MRKIIGNRFLSLIAVMLLLVSSLPGASAVQAADPVITIDGIKDADWGAPLAADPLGDMSEPNLDLNNLYVVEDADNLYIGFDAFASTWGMTYGIYLDTDMIEGSGATSDPWGRAVNALSAHLPEHSLYVWHPDNDTLQDVQLNHWNGTGWSYDSLISQGGEQAYGAGADWIEYRVPKAALGNPSQLALELFTTGGSGHAQDTVPSDPNVAYSSPDFEAGITTLSAFALFPKPAWYVRGDFNGWGLDNPMLDNGTSGDAAAGDGIFSAQVSAPTGTRYQFKIATGDWSFSYPLSGNSWLDTSPVDNAALVTFDTNAYLDGWLPETNIIGASTEPGAWTAVGDWQGWNNTNPASVMTETGAGIYTLTTAIPSPGAYQYKAVNTGTWDAIGADSRGVNASTAMFETTEPDQNVTFLVNPLSGRIKVEVEPPPNIPRPDNNIWWDGLGHNSRDDLYRVPGGAVHLGTPVTLRFRTYKDDVTSVTVRMWSTAAGSQALLPMEKIVTTAEEPFGYDYWQVTLPAQDQATILYYRFIVRDGSDEDYYEDDSMFDGAWGAAYEDSPDYSFQIDVYRPDFETPDWMKNAVIYQIFPDRFFNGRSANDARVTDPTVYENEVVVKSWEELPEGYCRGYQFAVEPCDEQPMGRDFFGGDLQGVREQLDYLKELGVTAIYFNPLFQAPSNHLYDTTDYTSIDPYFGTNKDFTKLVKTAQKLGIRVILDGVFNHTSSDSLYFDRYSRYSTLGAYESQASPYYDWFTFSDWPITYNSWWGFDSLPVLTEIQDVRDFIYANNDSVARYWLQQGAYGWRLDVAPDKSHNFWQEFRPQVKSAQPEAVIIGEIWDDASPWLLGDEFDSTMNYRFRRALLGFLNGDSSDPNQGSILGLNPEQFDSTLQSIKEDYPEPAFYAMMNLVGTHDTQRILWALTPGERNREDKEFNEANLAEGKAKLKLLAILQMTLPGAPTLYYGDEVGLTGDTDPDDRRPFPWDSMDTGMLAHYQQLTRLRNRYSFLRTGSFDSLYTNNDEGTYAYGRKDASGAAVIAVNRDSLVHTLTIDVSGYLPDGSRLLDRLNGGNLTVRNGEIRVTVNGRWGAVLVSLPNVDLVPPAAPADLTAEESNNQVSLSWQPVSKSAGYNIYRSLFSGGGYSLLNDAPLTSTTYTDTTVENGQIYYYVVTAVDRAGNESERSNEADALPHLIIGWANLQWPPTLQHTISAVDATDDIYGQVWIDGVTNQPGATTGLLAQVGYGPDGSDPSTGAGWTWFEALFNVDAGSNDEFKGQLLPTATGTFDYAYRYTTTGGREWIYADLDGIDGGYSPDQAGSLEVLPSGDTTPPLPPDNLRVTSATPSSITMTWDPVVDDGLYGYEILRSDTSGGPYDLVGSLAAPATEFTDWNVVGGAAYFYVVQAVDNSFNRSDPSAELAAVAEPRQVQVTFNVTVPDWTSTTSVVHIAGSFNNWDPGGTPMMQVDATHWTITLTLDEGSRMTYKYTLGSWDNVEKGADCEEISDRVLNIVYGTDGTQTKDDIVLNWRGINTCPF